VAAWPCGRTSGRDPAASQALVPRGFTAPGQASPLLPPAGVTLRIRPVRPATGRSLRLASVPMPMAMGRRRAPAPASSLTPESRRCNWGFSAWWVSEARTG